MGWWDHLASNQALYKKESTAGYVGLAFVRCERDEGYRRICEWFVWYVEDSDVRKSERNGREVVKSR